MGTRWEAALFDVEGVIAHQDTAQADRRLDALRAGLRLAEVDAVRQEGALYALWQDYSCGRIDADAYWSAVLAGLGLDPQPERVREVYDVQGQTAWSRLDEAVIDLVRRLRARGDLRLGLLSNSAPEYELHIGRFAGLFDVAHFSHRTGLRKPDPEAYLGAARALGAPPEAIVFVDDKARNVDAARALGFRALAFRGADALAADLASLGLL